jgi:hypothetical protein
MGWVAGSGSITRRRTTEKVAQCARIGRLDREAEVSEDGAAGVAAGEHGEDAHGAAAGVADQDVDREYALHERGPREPTERTGATADVHRRGGMSPPASLGTSSTGVTGVPGTTHPKPLHGPARSRVAAGDERSELALDGDEDRATRVPRVVPVCSVRRVRVVPVVPVVSVPSKAGGDSGIRRNDAGAERVVGANTP